MHPGRMIGGILCLLVVVTVFGAILLRGGVALYNKMSGWAHSPNIVPEPDFVKAMVITFVTWLVNTVAGLVVCFVSGIGGAAGQQGTVLMLQLIGLPISLLIMAGMLSAMLPTTFPRAILVTLCSILVYIAAAIGVAIIVLLVMFGLALIMRRG